MIPPSANEVGALPGRFHFWSSSSNIQPIPEAIASTINEHGLDQLCVRLNNLNFCHHELERLKMELIDFCNNNTQLTIPMERWNDLFVDTLVNLDAAIGYMAQYLSTRIVYVDMRKEAVEGLYVPSPSKSRVSPLLEQIFPKLITLCNFLADDLRVRFVTSLFQTFIEMYEYVLLWGGPSRVYSLSDHMVFIEDVQEIENFFQGEGDQSSPYKISSEVIQTFCIPLKMMAGDIFNQSSDALIKRYNEPGDDALSQSTMENILAVLYHRSDKSARKFIRQHSSDMPIRILETRRKRNATNLTLIKRGLDLHSSSSSSSSSPSPGGH